MQNKKSVFLRLLGYLKPHVGTLVLSLVLVFVVTASDLLRPILIGNAMDVITAGGLFSQIVRIRSLRAAGKRLDPAQEEWYRANRDLVDLKTPITPGEEALLRLWGGPERQEVAHETTSI